MNRLWQQETRGGGTLTIEGNVIIPCPADPTAAVAEWAGLPRLHYSDPVMSIGVRYLWWQSLRQRRRMARLEYRIVLYKEGE